MLTNKEFSVLNNTSVELSSDMAEMAMFTIQMNKVQHCVGRNESGKRILKPLFPAKRGDLWEVKGINETRDFGSQSSRQTVIREKVKTTDEIKAENIAKYAAIVESGGQLFSDEIEEEFTKDEKFFAVDCEMVGGKCHRKGGVKNHASFEALVDG
jgi:hypothetical protein